MSRIEMMDALEGHILRACADRTRPDTACPALAWSDVVTVLSRVTDFASQVAAIESKAT